MNGKLVFGALAVLAAAVLGAGPAHAGGGVGKDSYSNFLECQAINGQNVQAVVDFYGFEQDSSGNYIRTRQNVSVGGAALRCQQVKVKLVGDADFMERPEGTDQMKCYAVNVQGAQGNPQPLAMNDAFFFDPSAPEVVHGVQAVKYLCGPMLPTAVPE